MKVVVLNDNAETNNTIAPLVLAPFQDGMREAGAELTLFHTEKLDIKPCRGCKKCLYKTPGGCYQRDDMQVVLSELSRAEVWVYATQPTSHGLSASMKRLVDRMLPLTWPTVDSRLGPTRSLGKLVSGLLPWTRSTAEIRDHQPLGSSHEGAKAGKLVLVSSSDNRELVCFDPLIRQMQSVAQTHDKVFARALLRPHAGVIEPVLGAGRSLDDIVAAAYEAGRQLVQKGKMRPETLAVVGREILPQEASVMSGTRSLQQASAVA